MRSLEPCGTLHNNSDRDLHEQPSRKLALTEGILKDQDSAIDATVEQSIPIFDALNNLQSPSCTDTYIQSQVI